MKQKTVRFYEESKEDMAAFDKLELFREYGFSNAREFIIAAINKYAQGNSFSPVISVDVNELAESIVEKMKIAGFCLSVSDEKEAVMKEDNADVFEKALNFIENL